MEFLQHRKRDEMRAMERKREREHQCAELGVGSGNAQVCRCRVLQEPKKNLPKWFDDEFFNRVVDSLLNLPYLLSSTCLSSSTSSCHHLTPPPTFLFIYFHCVNFRFHSVKRCIIILVYCSTMLKVYCIVRCTHKQIESFRLFTMKMKL